MQARSLLMIEHRLIERMISVIEDVSIKIVSTQEVDPVFVDTAVDFIRTYADRTHHGKEEDILFRKLRDRDLAEKDRRTMEELIEEHVFGRQTTKALIQANARYREGDKTALRKIGNNLRTITEFYPKHIEKEDKVFFPAYMKYMTVGEDQSMLAEFLDFDRQMIHEKYRLLVEALEKAKQPTK
jgi:hemerythrin-like domain-containing protein